MTDPLPPALAAIERELAARPGAAAPADLRDRVLAAVGRQLGASDRPAGARLLAVAAAVLLLVNLSMSVANDAGWETSPPPDAVAFEAAVAEVRELYPDLPEHEVHHLAARIGTAPLAAPVPRWHPDRNRVSSFEELTPWATH